MRKLLAVKASFVLAAFGVAMTSTPTADAAHARHQRVIASGSSALAASSYSVTLPAGTGTVAGRHVVVAYMFSGGGTDALRSVTDSKGNKYVVHVARTNAGTSGLSVAIASAKLSVPLVSGDRITAAQSASNTYHSLVAYEFDNFASTGWVDRTASGNSAHASTTVATARTATTTQANETLISATAFGDTSATLRHDSGWVDAAAVSASGGKTKSLAVAVRRVSATGAHAYSGTLSAANQSVTVIAAFRTTSPTARLATAPKSQPGGSAAPLGVGGSWRQTFGDEFSGTSLDTTKWSYCYPWRDCSNAGNANEGQCYDEKNVSVSGGNLVITAKSQKTACNTGKTKDYTSGLVQTQGKFDQAYGFWEARIKVPSGLGMWPAFWMLPSTSTWPPEIDVLEIFGSLVHPDHSTHTLHHDGGQSSTQFFPPGVTFDQGFHTFGVNWQPTFMDWYVDGRLVKHYTRAKNIPSAEQYAIVNLAINTNHDASAYVLAEMRVDYVRVWK